MKQAKAAKARENRAFERRGDNGTSSALRLQVNGSDLILH